MPKTHSKGLSIAINEQQHEALGKMALQSFRSMTSIVREMIVQRIELWEKINEKKVKK